MRFELVGVGVLPILDGKVQTAVISVPLDALEQFREDFRRSVPVGSAQTLYFRQKSLRKSAGEEKVFRRIENVVCIVRKMSAIGRSGKDG